MFSTGCLMVVLNVCRWYKCDWSTGMPCTRETNDHFARYFTDGWFLVNCWIDWLRMVDWSIGCFVNWLHQYLCMTLISWAVDLTRLKNVIANTVLDRNLWNPVMKNWQINNYDKFFSLNKLHIFEQYVILFKNMKFV